MASARDASGGGVRSARMASSVAAFHSVTMPARAADPVARIAPPAIRIARMRDGTAAPDRADSVLENLEREPDVRCATDVGAQRFLDHLAFSAAEPAGAADDGAMSDHADLAESRLEPLGPDRIAVVVEPEHLRGVEPHVIGAEIAGEEALATPDADPPGLRRIALPRALLQRTRRKHRTVDDEGRPPVRPERFGMQDQAGGGDDRE